MSLLLDGEDDFYVDREVYQALLVKNAELVDKVRDLKNQLYLYSQSETNTAQAEEIIELKKEIEVLHNLVADLR